MKTAYLRRCGRLVVVLLTVYVYEVDLILCTGVQVDRLAEIGRWRCARLLLKTLGARVELCIVDTNLACRRELDRTR